MDDQPSHFQKTLIKQYPARTAAETAESRYWRRFRAPDVSQQVSPFACLHSYARKLMHTIEADVQGASSRHSARYNLWDELSVQ